MRISRLPVVAFLFILSTPSLTLASQPDLPASPELEEEPASEGDDSSATESRSKKRSLASWNSYRGPWLTLNAGAMVIYDVNGLDQDEANVGQVGDVSTQGEFRAGRLMLRGTMGRWVKVSYFYAGEYNGLSREPDDSALRMTDLAFTVDFERFGELTFGLTKEPFFLTRIMPGDGVLLMERPALDALVPSRNTGVKLSNTAWDQRLTWSVGWFNSWFLDGESFEDSDHQFSGRVTATPIYLEEGRKLLHLAVAGRYDEAEDGMFRYREPPEAHTAPLFVDTGAFSADHSETLGLELAAVVGPWSVQGEYLDTRVDSAANGDPRFSGWYLATNWILTGEHRPYHRQGGFFYKIVPDRPLRGDVRGPGAWEVVARYSQVDLDDGAVSGGEFQRFTLGTSWYTSRSWRFEVNWGRSTLDRFDVRGHTDFLQMRLQWVM